MAESFCRLSVTSRKAAAVVPAVVEGSADLMGLPPADRARLSTLVTEIIDAVLSDAYGAADEIELELEVQRAPGDIKVVLRDRGAPLDFGSGYPPRVTDLIRLGFADDLSFSNEGLEGNRFEIRKHLAYATISDDEAFMVEAQAEPTPEPTLGDDGEVVVDIRAMTPDDAVGVARLFYVTYGYTAAYASVVYEPELLAELVHSGQHVATVAVAPDGRIVGHVASQVRGPDAITGKIGLLAVDPLYRGHNLALRIGFTHVSRLLELGFVGQYSEAVTVHVGSQKAALQAGGHEVGIVLAWQTGEIDFRGFDLDDDTRKAVMLFYGSFGNTPQREVHVPPTYGEAVRRIYGDGNVPRIVHSDFRRVVEPEPKQARFEMRLNHDTGVAQVFVENYGADFLSTLQAQISQLHLNRFDLILVFLPMADPLTAYYGSGLQEIGLSFSGVYPEYEGTGDVLVLQNLNNVEVRPDEIQVASELGEYIKALALADYRQVAERAAKRDRSRATIARIYEALD